jgi:hypothetical protein
VYNDVMDKDVIHLSEAASDFTALMARVAPGCPRGNEGDILKEL